MIRYESVNSSIRQEDIHPGIFFEKEIKLAHNFISKMDPSHIELSCPFCKQKHEMLFRKWGFDYAICPQTWTTSIVNSVDAQTIFDYHHRSELSQFRASEEYQNESAKRRKELWENLISWIAGRVSRYLGERKYIVSDWGGRLGGWIDLLLTSPFTNKLYIEDPLPPLKRNASKKNITNIACLIDVLHRVTNPRSMLNKISQKITAGGLLFITCRSGSGFDILTLLGKSETIYPLDHIFLPSPKGIKILLEDTGFEILEIATPGLMDIKYIHHVKEMIPRNQYFLRYIIEQEDSFLFERMQSFLQKNNLSSHLRCLARKK